MPGATVELTLEVENRQRVHCVVTPMLSPLVGEGGATWFPEAELLPPSLLVAPGESGSLAIRIRLPEQLPQGTYRGSLLLHGFREGGLPVVLTAGEKAPAKRPRHAKSQETRARRAAP